MLIAATLHEAKRGRFFTVSDPEEDASGENHIGVPLFYRPPLTERMLAIMFKDERLIVYLD